MEWLSSLGLFGTIVRGIIVFIEAILVLNLLIVVHEWGHFLAARWRGLKVEKFYVWFGKPLWKTVYNGVEYGIGCIPLGGFVQLPQMGPMGGIEGEEPPAALSTHGDAMTPAHPQPAPMAAGPRAEVLPPITPLDKIIVAFAGPLFSFLLAVVFAWMVYGIGMPDRRIHTTVIGWIAKDMPAASAGFKPGDQILSIDGVDVHSWDEPVDSVKERIAFSKNDKITFMVKREGADQPVEIKTGFKVLDGTLFQRRGLRTVGLQWSYPAQIWEVRKGSAAERAGLKKGDVIAQVNGVKLYGPQFVYDAIEANPTAPLKLEVQRAGSPQEITLTPLAPEKPATVPDDYKGLALSGILFEDPGSVQEFGIVHPLPSKMLADSSSGMFRTLAAVFGKKGDVGFQQMGGPVKIINTYYMLFQIPDGWRLVLWFSVLLNVNLAIMNLFPFPVFDGGHIVMAIGEWLRKGSLLPMKIMEGVQYACVLTLLCFFVYVTWFDVNDLFGHSKKDEPKFKLDDLVYPASK